MKMRGKALKKWSIAAEIKVLPTTAGDRVTNDRKVALKTSVANFKNHNYIWTSFFH